jgi:hypothetical protein
VTVERYLCKDACEYCGKPVYADEGYHGVSLNHYNCQGNSLERFEEACKKLDELVEDFGIKPKRKKVREGEGRIAQKCIKLATEAFERETGGTVTRALIWNQQGRYRGPKWDLAAWGVDFHFISKEGHQMTGNVVSWSTMTQVSKLDKMDIVPSGTIYAYEH